MHYHDSKYNIGLHKIGVKLFGRPFDRPLFEGCSYEGPNREDNVAVGRRQRGEHRNGGSSNHRREVRLTHTVSQSFIGCKVVNPRSSAT